MNGVAYGGLQGARLRQAPRFGRGCHVADVAQNSAIQASPYESRSRSPVLSNIRNNRSGPARTWSRVPGSEPRARLVNHCLDERCCGCCSERTFASPSVRRGPSGVVLSNIRNDCIRIASRWVPRAARGASSPHARQVIQRLRPLQACRRQPRDDSGRMRYPRCVLQVSVLRLPMRSVADFRHQADEVVIGVAEKRHPQLMVGETGVHVSAGAEARAGRPPWRWRPAPRPSRPTPPGSCTRASDPPPTTAAATRRSPPERR
jgi:hypothetical protein